ncbi:MAG TPA: hypothetical protein VKS21_02690 [Spirochaetota bacterium]|nr:hypothetical protein [Spirochaetota bacterium]
MINFKIFLGWIILFCCVFAGAETDTNIADREMERIAVFAKEQLQGVMKTRAKRRALRKIKKKYMEKIEEVTEKIMDISGYSVKEAFTAFYEKWEDYYDSELLYIEKHFNEKAFGRKAKLYVYNYQIDFLKTRCRIFLNYLENIYRRRILARRQEQDLQSDYRKQKEAAGHKEQMKDYDRPQE